MPNALNKLRIGTKIGASVALGVAIVSALGLLFYRSATQMVQTAHWETHTYQVLTELETLMSTLKDAETAQRGYLLTGDTSYLETYNAATSNLNRKVDRLRKLVVDNPIQQQRLDRAEDLIRSRVAQMGQTIETRRTKGLVAASQAVTTNRSKQSTETIRQLASDMGNEERTLLQQRSAETEAATRQMVYSLILGIPLYSLLLGLIGVVLSRNISKPLRKFAGAAERVANDDLSVSVPVGDRQDEIGVLAQAFNQMVINLRKTTRQNAEQDWLKTNLANFSRLLQGQRDLETVSKLILSELAPLVNAQHGALYQAKIKENQPPYLKLLSGYAYRAQNLATRFNFGEGLVGQCALEKQRILLTEVPTDYIKVSSALGEAAPSNIVVLPAVFEDKTVAVIELASFQRFEEIHLTFLDQLAESIAVVFNTIAANMQTEQLLRQSRSLTEELQTQQEELTESNLRLGQQTKSLLKSEERLKQQQEELKQANDSLQQLNEELEEKTELLTLQNREVERKSQEVEQARRSLEEKAEQLEITSRYKSEFLANMSHELRTPLNSLLILARLLSENEEGTLTSKQVDYARTIYSSGGDLLTLINDILDLSKIESGMMSVEIEPLSFDTLQKQIEQTFRQIAQEQGLGFVIQLSDRLPNVIYTDSNRLQQVLKNLLSNAFKFTERGQVKLEIDVATQGWSADCETLNQANTVIAFAVSDTGIGVAANKQRIIFEAFQQADGTTSRRYGGTGLGLSISREIAHLLGGEVCLKSELGTGSTFTLYLPEKHSRSRQALEAKEVGLPSQAFSSSLSFQLKVEDPSSSIQSPVSKRSLLAEPEIEDDREAIQSANLRGDESAHYVLLIIEDDINFAKIVLDMAHDQGFKGLIATQGEVGIALAEEFKPAAIMLDIHLPDMDGWMVLDRLKHSPSTRHIPIHMMSVEEGQRRSLQNGAIAFLQKPISPETLNGAFIDIKDFVDRSVKNLLIVEDDDIQRRSIMELIGDGDVRSTAVGTGAEALAALKSEHFDCMVLDLGLPDMSGFELIEQIKQEPDLNYLPIIVYTGKELSAHEETELRRISNSIIIKDVRSPERLLDETALFLHRVQANLPAPKRMLLERLRQSDPILADKKALIVDDDMRNLFALTSLLERYGMQVIYAENGRDAISILQNNPDTDIVLIDIMMPEMDGYETVRAIRQTDQFASLPVIALTAKAMKGDREKCIDAGASDYITKPVDTEQLLSLMRVWLYR